MLTIDADQMNKIDENSEKLGLPRVILMENAGRAVAEYANRRIEKLKGKKIVIVAGNGNNGGDGFVAARHLAGYGIDVLVILVGEEKFKTNESNLNWKVLRQMSKSVSIITRADPGFLALTKRNISNADVIIDALFGTGIKGKIKQPYSKVIDLMNRSKAYTIAVDIPSGLDPMTGVVHDKSVIADTTLTFHKMRTGLIDRMDITGEVIIVPIGIPPEAEIGVL